VRQESEVRDAHDRYANIEIAYLLQLMEEYEGMAILATNLRQNVDEAFARRMRYVVEFPFPSPELRRRIRERVFPDRTPVADEIDFGFLARRFELAGGSIRNAALGAAALPPRTGAWWRWTTWRSQWPGSTRSSAGCPREASSDPTTTGW
jgi:SpoVK/Ycf46/Vps4 family AAA+-type ATPase